MSKKPEPQAISQTGVPPLHEMIVDFALGGHAGAALIAASQLENAIQELIADRMPNLWLKKIDACWEIITAASANSALAAFLRKGATSPEKSS